MHVSDHCRLWLQSALLQQPPLPSRLAVCESEQTELFCLFIAPLWNRVGRVCVCQIWYGRLVFILCTLHFSSHSHSLNVCASQTHCNLVNAFYANKSRLLAKSTVDGLTIAFCVSWDCRLHRASLPQQRCNSNKKTMNSGARVRTHIIISDPYTVTRMSEVHTNCMYRNSRDDRRMDGVASNATFAFVWNQKSIHLVCLGINGQHEKAFWRFTRMPCLFVALFFFFLRSSIRGRFFAFLLNRIGDTLSNANAQLILIYCRQPVSMENVHKLLCRMRHTRRVLGSSRLCESSARLSPRLMEWNWHWARARSRSFASIGRKTNVKHEARIALKTNKLFSM